PVPGGPVRAGAGRRRTTTCVENVTGGLGTGTSRYLRTGPGRASRARTGLNDLACQPSLVLLPPADGAARPSDSPGGDARRPSRPTQLRPGGPREEETRGGGGASSQVQVTLALTSPRPSLRGTAPLALRARSAS
ncbi:hypothetical protein THAOC_33233, partial [Thalassiosira oceanica]